jgi:excisionase family DNA binding protein
MRHPSPTVSRRYASLRDAADYIGVNEKTIRRHITAGRVTGYRIGSRLVRVDLNELDAALRPIPTVGGDAA